MIRSVLFVVLLCGLSFGRAHGADTAAGMATIVEGPATLVRGKERLRIAEGVRVLPEDIVETETAAFVRVELSDGTILDLGPATRVLLLTKATARGPRQPRLLYLLSGWVKLSMPGKPALPYVGFSSRLVDGVELAGTLLVRADDDLAMLFTESGSNRLADRSDSGAPLPLTT